MISKDFTHTWALAIVNYFATHDNHGEIPNNTHVEDEEQHDSEEQQGVESWSDEYRGDCSAVQDLTHESYQDCLSAVSCLRWNPHCR